MLSGQQYQLASGQHPAGQEVSSDPHCLLAAILVSFSFMATKGQSAAVAAQYMLSGQQYQLAFGQHPAGHEVSSDPHCLLAAILVSFSFMATKGQSAAVAAQYMLSGQQYQLASGQTSWARGLIRSALLVGSHLGELLVHCNKRTVSSSGSTVHVVGAAVPVSLWAASSWA